MNKLSVGDLVVLIDIEIGCSAYKLGLRIGAIGKILKSSDLTFNGYRWIVDFPTLKGTHCPEFHLRKIDPPEAGRWDYCVWDPGKETSQPTLIEIST